MEHLAAAIEHGCVVCAERQLLDRSQARYFAGRRSEAEPTVQIRRLPIHEAPAMDLAGFANRAAVIAVGGDCLGRWQACHPDRRAAGSLRAVAELAEAVGTPAAHAAICQRRASVGSADGERANRRCRVAGGRSAGGALRRCLWWKWRGRRAPAADCAQQQSTSGASHRAGRSTALRTCRSPRCRASVP